MQAVVRRYGQNTLIQVSFTALLTAVELNYYVQLYLLYVYFSHSLRISEITMLLNYLQNTG